MFHSRPYLLVLILTLALLLSLMVSLSVGAVSVPMAEWGAVIRNHIISANAADTTADLVIWQIRLPRVLLAALVGACLALSGAMVQGLFRNPLADPSLIGVSGGAAVGAACAIVLGANVTWLPPALMLPLLAFIGGSLVTALVYRLGVGPLGTSVATMLLAGVAVNAMTSASISYLATVAEDARLRNLVYWLMGSFNVASWQKVL